MRWHPHSEHGDYTLWYRFDDSELLADADLDQRTLWQVTKDGQPPCSGSGYYDKQWLLKHKGITS